MKQSHILLLTFLIVLLSVGYSAKRVYFDMKPYRYNSVESVPEQTIAMVFGASVRRDGSLSPVLRDRVNAAAALYRMGKVKKILMSGDNRNADYDEVTAMKRHAENQGVASSDITLDYAGFSTYESCYRAKEIFSLPNVVIITQNYHLTRALYTCRTLGLDAVGLGLPDWQKYPTFMVRALPREGISILKSLIQLHITRPLPTYLGPKEVITY